MSPASPPPRAPATVLFLVVVAALLLLSSRTPRAHAATTAFAPNHFLGKCLDAAWVQSVEAALNVSASARDAQRRLEEPHLHAALPSRRFAVTDARIANKSMDAIFTRACTATPFTFWGVGARVDAADAANVTHAGAAAGSLVVEFREWTSAQLATMAFAILAREVLGYDVSFFATGDSVAMGERMSSVGEGTCTPVHVNVEEWGRNYDAFTGEIYKAGTQGYVGRSGLYTTTAFVAHGAAHVPVFNADFWRDYATNDDLIAALDVELITKNAAYDPAHAAAICPDGTMGCRNGCSRTDTCTARETGGGKCLGLALMMPSYDDGKAEAVLANNKVPSYHCFLGFGGVEAFAVAMEAQGKPVFFYHFEPDTFHFIHAGKFQRVFLPRSLPALARADTATFGENGFGAATDNPVAVDFPTSALSLYGAKILQDHPAVYGMLSRMTLSEMDITTLFEAFVNITTLGAAAIEPADATFSAACAWVRSNYATWKLWLDRLPKCDLFSHMQYDFAHCDDGAPREIVWSWATPDPRDASQPFVCDGGAPLPRVIRTSKSCAWLRENVFSWIAWTLEAPLCDAQFYNYTVSECTAQATRLAVYHWLLPDPADANRSLECRDGAALPATVELACEYAPHDSPLFRAVLALAVVLAAALVVMAGFVVRFRREPIIKRSQFEFLVAMIVGGVLLCGAAVLYGGEPTHFLCAARPLVTSLGFTLIFGALVVKSMRVYRVFMSGAMKRVVLSSAAMFKILGLFALVDGLILLAWFVVDFPTPVQEAVSVGALNGGVVLNDVCMSSSFIFTALLLFWKALVLFMGLYLSFLIRNVSTDFQESIWIFASSLVVLFGSIIILPMAYLVELPASVFFAFLAFMLLGCTALVMGMMLVPKIGRLHERANDTTTKEATHGESSGARESASDETRQSNKVSKLRFGVRAPVQVTPVEAFRPKSVKSKGKGKGKRKAGTASGDDDSSDDE